jgi:hypothetical protein
VIQKLPNDTGRFDEFASQVKANHDGNGCAQRRSRRRRILQLWHGEGFNVETSGAVAKVWREAMEMGYDAYKRRLISEGKYRQKK